MNQKTVKTFVKAFRLYERHKLFLANPPYAKNAGLLIRLLLDAYFNGELISVKARFDRERLKREAA